MRIFLQKMEFIEGRELARSRLVLSLQGEVSSRHLEKWEYSSFMYLEEKPSNSRLKSRECDG